MRVKLIDAYKLKYVLDCADLGLNEESLELISDSCLDERISNSFIKKSCVERGDEDYQGSIKGEAGIIRVRLYEYAALIGDKLFFKSPKYEDLYYCNNRRVGYVTGKIKLV